MPGFPIDPRYSGTNNLLKKGANLLESAQDVIDVLNNQKLKYIKNNMLFESSIEFLQQDNQFSESELERIEKLVLSSLNTTPVDIDFLIRTLNVPSNLLILIIIELELNGRILRSNNSLSVAL